MSVIVGRHVNPPDLAVVLCVDETADKILATIARFAQRTLNLQPAR